MVNYRKVALVTGATGFIGSALVRELISSGYIVRAITSGVGKSGSADLDILIDWYPNTELGIRKSVVDISHFFNFAVVYDKPNNSNELIFEVNVSYPLKILSEINNLNKPVFCVFGDTFYRKFAVNSTLQPRYTYSKNVFYKSVELLSHKSVCNFAFLVIEQVYGPGESLHKAYPSIIREMISNASRIPLTSGTQKRDFIYISDLISAIRFIAESNWVGLINIGCGVGSSISVQSVFNKLKRISGSGSVLGFGDLPQDQNIDESFANIHFLHATGWKPKVKIDLGLKLLVDYVQSSHGL
jgi:nucleoside-diphosphate-sugar epimerase